MPAVVRQREDIPEIYRTILTSRPEKGRYPAEDTGQLVQDNKIFWAASVGDNLQDLSRAKSYRWRGEEHSY